MLRSLFLLLVLLNLGVLATFSWFVKAPEPRPDYEGPGITLLREVDPASLGAPDALVDGSAEPVPVSEPAAVGDSEQAGGGEVNADANADDGEVPAVAETLVPAAQPGPDRCISIGPFTTDGEVDTAMQALKDAGFAPTLSTREAEVWDGYWVFIDRLEDQAAARQVAAELAENGISDTQVIPGSDRGTLLSIGVFSDIRRAGTQADRVRQIGYDATIANSMKTSSTQWLDVVLTSEESIALDLLQEPGRISRLQQVACRVEPATD
jgi:hypothetical protein